jgi:hypothetical protein
MATAAIYGLLASSSFVVGVVLGLVTKPPRRLPAVVIAFGSGVLGERRHWPQLARRGPQPRDRAARGGVPGQCSREPGQHGGQARGRALARLHHRGLDRVGVVCVLATVAGYALLGGLSPGWVSAILALAAGGILALLADTMFPEAFEHGGRWVALATAIGFACAFLLSELTGSV